MYIQALQHLNYIKFKLNPIQWHINLLTHQEVCAHYELKKYEIAHDILHCR
jgi:hypothetical protein